MAKGNMHKKCGEVRLHDFRVMRVDSQKDRQMHKQTNDNTSQS